MGGHALHEKLKDDPAALSRKMRKAVKARWKKFYAANPDKLAAAKARRRKNGRKAA